MADTDLQQLVINVGTTAQIQAGIAGGTITQDMLSVSTDGPDYLQGVQVNGTDLTPDANNKVNIAKASNDGTVVGVVQLSNTYGSQTVNGYLAAVDRSYNGFVGAQSTSLASIGGVKAYVGGMSVAYNASQSLTDAQKTQARTNIGAVGDVQVNGTSVTTSGVANIPYASTSDWGVIKIVNNYGIGANSNGQIYILNPTDTQIETRSGFIAVSCSKIDKAVMEGLGNNSLTWTDAYKASACNTIGAEAKSAIVALSATDSITLADNTIYNGGTQTSLTIALPSTDSVLFVSEMVFTSGSTATTLSYPNTIKWLGDDISSNVFVPVASKRYTVIFYYDGSEYVGVVKGVG